VGSYNVETYRYECALSSTKRIALRPKNLGWVTGDWSLCARWGTGDTVVHEFLQDSEKMESSPFCACGCGVGTQCLQRRTYSPPLTSILNHSQGLGKLFADLRAEDATHTSITQFVNLQDNDNGRAGRSRLLHKAAQCAEAGVIEVLLREGADPIAVKINECTPFGSVVIALGLNPQIRDTKSPQTHIWHVCKC